MASVVCASVEIEPRDIAPVANLFTISDTGSTSSILIDLLISLNYQGKTRKPVIETIERISKPSLRIYTDSKSMPVVLNNLGIAILSTSNGVMTNIKAKELGIGGEILCYIW